MADHMNGTYGAGSYGANYGGYGASGIAADGYGGAAPHQQVPTSSYMHPAGRGINDDSASGGTNNLRRRHIENADPSSARPSPAKSSSSRTAMVKKFDFMFPKVDSEYTVQTDRGGAVSIVAYVLIAILVVAEIVSWSSQNMSTTEHISVDTTMGQRMRVNIDITFPALACEDLHLDVMDVAGDSQMDIDTTLMKKRMTLDGKIMGRSEKVESNKHFLEQQKKEEVVNDPIPDDYCGPCYGAQQNDGDCCNTCDDLLKAYKTKRWNSDSVLKTSEQCIREGRDRVEPKRMTKGQGCNLSGHLDLNRVSGNFHVAMGEGIERDGRHIHSFVPEDTPNFNASHIINELSFGPQPTWDGFMKLNSVVDESGQHTLNGVKKIVTKEYGTTGLFQYFIKVVPTTYIQPGKESVSTNRYFFTERFRPLMTEYIDEEEVDPKDKTVVANAGHGGGHSNQDHHNVRNAVLPGVFFIYEIFPFTVELSRNSVPISHLIIRLMATVGGVFTIVRWADAFLFAREKSRR